VPRYSFLAILFFAGAIPCLAVESKADIAWRNDADSAIQFARQNAKPILYEYWATWCEPCKRMDREVWSQPRVIAAARKYVAISVEIRQQTFVDPRFGVQVIPTVIVTDPWGRILARQEGLIRASEMIAMLEPYPADFTEVSKWGEALQENRGMRQRFGTSGCSGRSTAHSRSATPTTPML
jgi:thiol-disulfide isomerase/thioredoxin